MATIPADATVISRDNTRKLVVCRKRLTSESKSEEFIDVRQWLRMRDGDFPTKKGVCLRPSEWPQIIEAINRLLENKVANSQIDDTE